MQRHKQKTVWLTFRSICFRNALMSLETNNMTPNPTDSGTCPKCGTIKKSGKRSCCARGGTWFKKCGDEGDTTFDHTWTEGIEACKSKFSSGCHVCLLYYARNFDCVSTVVTKIIATPSSISPDTSYSSKIATVPPVATGSFG